MPDSIARETFEANVADVERLLKIHEEVAGTEPGRKYGVSALNKAAIVLTVTAWETYCKDAAIQSLRRILEQAETPDSLEKAVRFAVAEELRNRKNPTLVWRLAGDEWREFAVSILTPHTEIGSLNAANVTKMMKNMIGLENLASTWNWQGMSVDRAAEKLLDLIVLRGDIVHKGSTDQSIRKIDVTDYLGHVERLVDETETALTNYLESRS